MGSRVAVGLLLIAGSTACAIDGSGLGPAPPGVEGGVDGFVAVSDGGTDGSPLDGSPPDGSALDAAGDDAAGPDASASDASTGDGGLDASACALWPLLPTGVDPCAVPPPTGEWRLGPGSYVYRTGTGGLDGASAPPSVLDMGPDPTLRIVSVSGLVIESGATLRVVGPHPVVFLVFGDADVSGTIDVSAWLDGSTWRAGPGGEVACGVGIGGLGPSDDDGAGGGGGGGFGEMGGAGGDGDRVGAGSAGGVEGNASLSPLRGGCRGGHGGSGDVSGTGGIRGEGGGAVQIAARDSLTVTGTIRASGGPGLGGKRADSGGGGGGSGGAVLLEAPVARIEAGARVCANGGGGGGGASDPTVVEGGDGSLGTCSASSAATGGSAGSGGSAGGAGGYAGGDAEQGRSGSEGGGGGGGAVGRVRIRASAGPVLDGTVTPAPM